MTQSEAAATAPRPTPDLVHGVVEAVNEKGLRIGGRWFNYSRFREVPRPDVGDLVEVLVKNHFIDELTPLAAAAAAGEPADRDGAPPLRPPAAAPAAGAARRPAVADRPAVRTAREWPPAADEPAAPDRPAAADRARQRQVTTRLGVLAAAADFLAGRAEAVPDDVLTAAIQWLVWVEEDDGVAGA